MKVWRLKHLRCPFCREYLVTNYDPDLCENMPAWCPKCGASFMLYEWWRRDSIKDVIPPKMGK